MCDHFFKFYNIRLGWCIVGMDENVCVCVSERERERERTFAVLISFQPVASSCCCSIHKEQGKKQPIRSQCPKEDDRVGSTGRDGEREWNMQS